MVVLVLFGCQFVKFFNDLLDRSSHLLLKILLDPGLQFDLGCHLLVKNAECDILEVSDGASLVIVEHILSHDVDQQYIFLVDVLLVFLDSLSEGHFFFPAQTQEIVFVFLDQHTVDLAVFKLLERLK